MAKWTRELIIRQILARESAGLPLSLAKDSGVDLAIYQAASRIFGSWQLALQAAGIALHRTEIRDRWSPARILAAIRRLARRRRPTGRFELKTQHRLLVRAAHRTFGSWHKAVVVAGVDPQSVTRVRWTAGRITEAILIRVLNNEPLNSRGVRPSSLVEAGARVFGSWRDALAAAGVDPTRYERGNAGRKQHTDDAFATFANLDRGGMGGRKEPAPVVATPFRLPPQTSRWTEPLIIEAIVARHRGQRKMNAGAVNRDDKRLYSAARRRYGRWSNALRAAGIPTNDWRSGNRSADGRFRPEV